MTATDLMGWTAAAATMLAFSMRAMIPLRIAALVANLCFIGYGTMAGLVPVIVLHLALLPCNLARLAQDARLSGMGRNIALGQARAFFSTASSGNQRPPSHSATFTRPISTGTSTSGPITAAKATGEARP